MDMPFKKGQISNPTGPKPGTFSLLTILKQRLRETPQEGKDTFAVQAIEQYIKHLTNGKPEMLKDALDRIDGKPNQPLEHTGEVKITINHD